MVDSTSSPVLKRKREGVEPLRKKVKTLKKNDTAAGGIEDVRMMDGATPEKRKEGGKISTEGEIKTPGLSRRERKLAQQRNAGTGSEHQSTAPTASPAVVKNEEGLGSGTPAGNSTPSLSKKEKMKAKKRNAATPIVVKTESKPEGHLESGTPNGLTTPSLSRKDKKAKAGKEHSEKPEGDQQVAQTPVSGSNNTTNVNGQETTPSKTALVRFSKKNSNKEKSVGKKREKDVGKHSWSLSPSMGGWFLPHDPVFTADEKFLILALPTALRIYATDTSNFERELRAKSISAYALSATNPNHIYTANEAGLITLWDWSEGSTVGRWDIGTNIQSITVVPDPNSNMDLVYSHERQKNDIVNVHALRTRQQASPTELKNIIKTKAHMLGVQVLLDGKIVVIGFKGSIMIGKRAKVASTALEELQYVWREFQVSNSVNTFDAYVHIPEPSATGEKTSSDSGDNLDLAVGDEDGVIWLFEDVLSSLSRIEKAHKGPLKAEANHEMLRPKRLHWHREAVASVKWSRDGNYLISGGKETVLVIWQLSTGKQQHLPHLTAAIENIVVSPTGASYSITLANNSVVVLSTTELEARMNIIGVQSRRVDLEQSVQEHGPNTLFSDLLRQIPMAVDPKNVNKVLFPVPSSQPRHGDAGPGPEPYMQTVDIATQNVITRQALTRNNATDPNVAPDGRPIQEPSVKFLQISNDGKWLATVDEWIPPVEDMKYLDEGIPEYNEEERTFRREVYLKFWQWDEKNAQWALESRIDAPHFSEKVAASTRVLDLIADPVETGFATIGEDRVVRIWRPKTRTRDGITVRGVDKSKGEGLVTWSLYRSIELSQDLDILELGQEPGQDKPIVHIQNSRLAFSADGSVLAAAVSDTSSGVIHIIDTITGTIRRSITELDVSIVSSLGIMGRHMVVVGRSIAVWDLVSDQLLHCIPEGIWNISKADRVPLARFVINAEGGTFAIALPHIEFSDSGKARARRLTKATSTVAIFDPRHPRPLWQSTVPNVLLALAPAKGGKGYITLDTNSSIRLLFPKGGELQLPTPPPEAAPQLLTEREQTPESEADEEVSGKEVASFGALEDMMDWENDKPVVRPEQLQGVFDVGASHALPPVKDLFNAVVGLYARKPRVAGAA